MAEEAYARTYAGTTGPPKGEKHATRSEAKQEAFGDEGRRRAREGGRRIAWRGLQEGSALSCKSVRSVSPPGGMVAYVKAGYTPRDEWTLFRAFLLLTLCSRFCTLTCRWLCTRASQRTRPVCVSTYSPACLAGPSPPLPSQKSFFPPSWSDGIDNPLFSARALVARVLACLRARRITARTTSSFSSCPSRTTRNEGPQIGAFFRRRMSYVAGRAAFFPPPEYAEITGSRFANDRSHLPSLPSLLLFSPARYAAMAVSLPPLSIKQLASTLKGLQLRAFDALQFNAASN